jgi:hypothetical protein
MTGEQACAAIHAVAARPRLTIAPAARPVPIRGVHSPAVLELPRGRGVQGRGYTRTESRQRWPAKLAPRRYGPVDCWLLGQQPAHRSGVRRGGGRLRHAAPRPPSLSPRLLCGDAARLERVVRRRTDRCPSACVCCMPASEPSRPLFARGVDAGPLCGECLPGHSQSLSSALCVPTEECADQWVIFVAVLVAVAYVVGFLVSEPRTRHVQILVACRSRRGLGAHGASHALSHTCDTHTRALTAVCMLDPFSFTSTKGPCCCWWTRSPPPGSPSWVS